MNHHHNTDRHKLLENLFIPLINSLDVSFGLPWFKCSKTLNIIFNEVITNDFTCIFMSKSSNKIGDVGVNVLHELIFSLLMTPPPPINYYLCAR